jgi:hypothetical protein
MITEGNFRLTGLKQSDITPEIENIIDKANEFILICGYSFTNHRNPRSILKKVIDSPVKSKHCILPINLFRGLDANRTRSIELVRNGVSVSIENRNHSKWVMSENEIYYGSANFSIDSLVNKIEVASFKYFQPADLLRSEFCDFVLDSIERMMHLSNRNSIKGVIGQNDRLTNSTKSLILRFNPTIEKVESTVDSINDVRSMILEIIENSYWFLPDTRYNSIVQYVSLLDNMINTINFKGIELLNTSENSRYFKSKVHYYNIECDKFLVKVPGLSNILNDYLYSENKIPSFTAKNRMLAKRNRSVISRLLEDNV